MVFARACHVGSVQSETLGCSRKTSENVSTLLSAKSPHLAAQWEWALIWHGRDRPSKPQHRDAQSKRVDLNSYAEVLETRVGASCWEVKVSSSDSCSRSIATIVALTNDFFFVTDTKP